MRWLISCLLVATALSTPTLAAEQRSCRFELAVFPTSPPKPTDFRMILAAKESAARVRVEGSGEWAGRRARFTTGAETVTFDTNAVRETVTIGAGGKVLWEIDYFDKAAAGERVIAFAGLCAPWSAQ